MIDYPQLLAGAVFDSGVIFDLSAFSLLVAAAAIVCWLWGWRAGVVASSGGLAAIAFLSPRLFALPVGSIGYVIVLSAFALVAGTVCLLAVARDRASRRLRLVERRGQELEHYLSTAQQFKRFWTWELDFRLKLWRWTDPYGILKSRKYEHIESWLLHVHPADRERCRTALAQAAESGELAMEFRVDTSSGQLRILANGFAPQEREQGRRLIGVSVALEHFAGD